MCKGKGAVTASACRCVPTKYTLSDLVPHTHVSVNNHRGCVLLLLLQAAVRDETVEDLLGLAERTNAWQLGAVCRHYIRNTSADDDKKRVDAWNAQGTPS
jgi:hypothetical protein